MMSPEPPPVTPRRKFPPDFGLDDVPPALFAGVPQAARGPASIAPPTTIPLLMSSRRRVIVEIKGFLGSGFGVSSIASLFLLLFLGRSLSLFQQPHRESQVLGHQVGRRGVPSPKRVDEFLVIPRVGSPGIWWMAAQQHSRLGGEGLVRLREPFAPGQPYQLVVKAKVGGDRLFSGRFLAGLARLHHRQRGLQLPDVRMSRT